MTFQLRPYQVEAVDAVIDHIKKRLSPCLLELATGAGKSLIVSAIARYLAGVAPNKRVLCIAPSKELIVQNHEKYVTGYKEPASIYCSSAGSKDLRHQVIFASPLTAVKNIRLIAHLGVSGIIIDECFPGETVISTPGGDVRIDEIKKGDVVYCAGGSGIVRSTFSKKSKTITIRTQNGKSIRCTPDHPIFTEKGFVAAEELENGARLFSSEDMRTLFEIISTKNDDAKRRENCCKRLGVSLEQAGMLFSILLKEMEKPNAQPRKQREDEEVTEENLTLPSNQGWERLSSECISALSLVCDEQRDAWMGNGTSNKDISWTQEWCLSELLQSGYWEQQAESSDRDRWRQPSEHCENGSGFKEGQQTFGVGMDRVSHIERGGYEVVYNLRVGGHPSYYANGFLVHNCHGVTPTMIDLIKQVQEYEINGTRPNENVRVIGMTATPYRTGTGYIYAKDCTGDEEILHDDDKARDPYYSRLLYRVSAGELVSQGYLTRPVIGETDEHYDTEKLTKELFETGKFNAATVSKTFEGNTKTERIVNKVMAYADNRKGVMFFAATISHAEEIASYLPAHDVRVITGKLKKSEREKFIKDFLAKRYKYLVNCDILTTGFDAVHVDLIAILRATESPGLLQQIIGRGLRLADGKEDVLILDYAENIERHGLENDIFTPEIKTNRKPGEGMEIQVECPACHAISMKKRRNDPIYDGVAHDRYGNFLVPGTERVTVWGDEYGNRYYGQDASGAGRKPCEWDGEVMTMKVKDPSRKDEFGEIEEIDLPMPAHYSRRCNNPEAFVIKGQPVRCEHRFSLKICPKCFAENDIAARHCTECKERLVDPNSKLTDAAGFANVMMDGEIRRVKCYGATYTPWVARATGNHSLKAEYRTEIGEVTAWHTTRQKWIFSKLAQINGADSEQITSYDQCAGWTNAPREITIRKTERNGYVHFEIKGVHYSEKESA